MQPQYITLHFNAKDLTGQRFGRLTALGPVWSGEDRSVRWHCRCACGNEIIADGRHLRSGAQVSCGCLRNEKTSARASQRNLRHGMARTQIYKTWKTMIQRCHYPGNDSYPNYGGRGIIVCREWRDSFESFYAHIGNRPAPGYSIDRIDVNGNYEPGNVRWATAKEQANNRRKSSRKSLRRAP